MNLMSKILLIAVLSLGMLSCVQQKGEEDKGPKPTTAEIRKEGNKKQPFIDGDPFLL